MNSVARAARLIAISALGVTAGGAWGQTQVVGRVLLSGGDTFAVRDGREVRLAFNSPVEFKDTLKTGPASSLQVRFVDESLLSLRDNTEFQIEEYQFAAKQDVSSERAFFRLIKGGFRAVTGAIGRTQNANYRVQTQTATIGIRGTDYAVRACAGDCGANVKDGVYGTVLGLSNGTNQVTVTNQATPQPVVFGINQHFHVPSQNAAPQQLLQPPTFVAVKPQGKAQAAQQGGQGTGTETASEGSGASAESRPQSVIDAGVAVTQLVGSTPYSIQNTAAGGVGIGDVGLLGCGGNSGSGDGCGGALGFLSNITFGLQSTTTIVTAFSNFIEHVGQPDQHLLSGTKGSLSVANAGCVSSTIAGCTVPNDPSFSAWFGRWQDGTFTDANGTQSFNSTTGNGQGIHYLFATSLTPFDTITAKSGVANFVSSLGTQPVNNLGVVGSISSVGPLVVTFGANPSASISSLQYSVGSQAFNFGAVPLKITRDSAAGGFASLEYATPNVGLAGVCTGGNCAGLTFLDVTGAFIGKLANHAGLNFSTKNNNLSTGMVRLYNCSSGAC